MSRRRLSDEERVLWKGVTRSIVPLRKPLPLADHDGEPPPSARPAAKPRAKSAPVPAIPPVLPKPAPPPLASLPRKKKQRIARGRDSIDGRLDLHGMTQHEAHNELFGFLRGRQARGAKLVLVITGKGARGDAESGRGVLKRVVPMWLRLPEFRELIVGFEPASAAHGGEGALYVSLRKSR